MNFELQILHTSCATVLPFLLPVMKIFAEIASRDMYFVLLLRLYV